ncbi:MAG: serine/threonine protein kinase [Deltaproteobacteria bacterium]|nr:serine/threonine protein kinase [Deltaproteobacteria bacterium]
MSLLGGRYETLKTIASGGMATVHLGRAVGVGGFERLVAIKLMHPHIAEDPEFVSMFLDEARLAARIRHPNVVATIDVQESSSDGLFLVMEYIEGPSLKSLRRGIWADGEQLPLDITLRIMVDALSGLDAAHTLKGDDGALLNLVHRDVSPANVLIGSDGISRITDFGVARAETRLSSTREGKLKGKIPYMPPEQLMAEPVDRRCDVYGAGVVLWETLIGRRLFKAPSEGALLQQILTGPAEPPSKRCPELPKSIDDICLRALARQPADRFASAADFAEALEEAARESGVGIATSRQVARFVEESQVYEPLDPQKLAKLKQAPMPASLLTPDNLPSTPSTTSAPSSVTATEATISQAPDELPPKSPSRRGLWIGLGVAALGLAAGLFVARSGDGDPGPVPAGSTNVGTAPSEVQPATSAEPDAPAAPSAATTAEPSAVADPSASASASAQVDPNGAPPPYPTARPPGPGPKTTPTPTSTRYDPDKL